MAKLEYAPAPESRSLVDLRSSYGLFIDGAFVDPVGGGAFKTVNPATEEVLAEVGEASAEDVDLAVRAARRAQARTWSLVTPSGRWTVTLTSRDSTAVSAPMNCQYSWAVSVKRLAAPFAT